MSKGYFILILQAHLPFVRHPEHEEFLEENWLFEAISETYLPLLRVFKRLEESDISFRLTISISPTLAAMLVDNLLQQRYIRYNEKVIELAEKEKKRTENEPEFNNLACMYVDMFKQNHHDFIDVYKKNILRGFKEYQEKGYLELITSGATHCFLPHIENYPGNVEAQIQYAVCSHQRNFSVDPKGIWLPECGYYPGLEDHLKRNGLQFFFTDTHGVLFAERKPKYGIYAPLYCNNLVAAFGRDPASSWAVWSAEDGYPGDYMYREYYRDIGYDLPIEYIRPYIHAGDLRINTGIKYYAITGPTNLKKPYNRQNALEKVKEHADNFVYMRCKQIGRLAPLMDRPPVIVSPFDAELFGHWWFEGPEWVEHMIRHMYTVKDTIKMISPSDYLKLHNVNQISTPSASSWGNNGYGEVWLDESNDWIYRHIHKAAERMTEIARKKPNATGLEKRALNQAARELLLAQASDWAFIMKTGTTVPYAKKRTKEHIAHFTMIYNSLQQGNIDKAWLSAIEKKYTIFPDIDYRVFTGDEQFSQIDSKTTHP
jgi:1,4-alpha-glucan branching enzyme